MRRGQELLTPQVLARGPAEWPVAAALALPLAGILAVDLATSSRTTIGGLSLLIVLAAAWLLSSAPALAVVTIAVALRVVAIVGGGVTLTTGLVHIVEILGGAAIGHAAAMRVLEEHRSSLAERDAARSAREQERTTRDQREQELSLLREAAEFLASSLSLADIERQIVRVSALMLAVAGHARWRASYSVVEGNTMRSVAEFDDADIRLGTHTYDLDRHPAIRRVVESATPVFGDIATMPFHDDATAEMVGRAGLRAAAMLPVAVDGRVVGVLSLSTRDAHEFSQDEMSRLNAITHLAELGIANATRFAAERRQVEVAQSLEQAKSRFLNLASHEMRGPLTVMRGYLSMIAEGDLGHVGPQLTAVIPLITGKVDELSRLVNQMLETARLEDHRLVLLEENVDARTVVSEAVRAVTPLLGDPRLIEVEQPDQALIVHADAARLATVLTNLLDNARKYSRSGSPIRVRSAADGDSVSIAVTDEGIGIGPDDVGTIFTRFGRVVTAENSHIPGTGLGLWISKEIARLHGGDILVRSEPGRGSTFTVVLPLATGRDRSHP